MEFAGFVATFAAFFAADRLTRSFASLDESEIGSAVLLVRAAAANAPAAIVLLVLFGTALVVRRAELLARWSKLEHGRDLQLLLAPVVFLLVWRAATYDYNYLADQWHVIDRLLLVGFGVGVVVRPVFLFPLAAQLRVINQQLFIPTGASSTQNMADLIVMVLLGVGAAHLLFIATRRAATSAALAVIGTAIASHFFVPGRGKISLGWLEVDSVANLVLASHTVGWLGGSDWASRLADAATRANPAIKIATLAVELGAVVAVALPRLFRYWLCTAISMHIAVFAMTGFWFGDWIVLEVGLAWLLTRRSTRDWVEQNATPLRALVAVAVVGIAGGRLFHPPNLAWLDSPISYAYRIEAVDGAGRHVTLPPSIFAPFEQDFDFMYLQLAPRRPAAFGYGAIYSADAVRELEDIDDFAQLARYEESLELVEVGTRDHSEAVVVQAVDRWWSGATKPWYLVAPPPRFWTSVSDEGDIDPSDVVTVDIVRVTSIHANPELGFRRERLLELARDGNERAQIVWRADAAD